MTQAHPLPMKAIPNFSTLESGFPGVRTFLFDMDGTLFDTEKYHTQALQRIGHEHKIVPPFGPNEVHQLMMGKADHLLYEIVKDWPGFPVHWKVQDFVAEKNRHLLKLLGEVKAESFFPPQLKMLLSELNDRKLNVGLVTSSEKVVTHELLKLADVAQQFSFILTRDDSKEVKPHPWPYLKAMHHFKAAPELTLIFEDSSVGIEAAKASGAHVIKAEWY